MTNDDPRTSSAVAALRWIIDDLARERDGVLLAKASVRAGDLTG
jgi:hypothetical protein